MPHLSFARSNRNYRNWPVSLTVAFILLVVSSVWWVSFGDVGSAEARQSLERNLAEPLSLATGDFDEDGVADLAGGYAANGHGVLALYRGNVDAIHPNAPEARRRRPADGAAAAPFLPNAGVFDLEVRPDFTGAGDFDADGHLDLVAAARGGGALFLIAGDGRGGFGAAKEISLPGQVTALAVGEVNRADGLADVAVGIVAGGAPKALVFEGPEGALRARAEEFPLPGEAAALALGRADQDYLFDVAIAAGREMVIVHGRDRRLSLGEAQREAAPAAKQDRYSAPSSIRSVAIGNFTDGLRPQVAALCDDGKVMVIGAVAGELKSETLGGEAGPRADRLIGARVSGGKLDDLVVLSSAGNHFRVINAGTEGADKSTAEFEVESAPVAAVAMRLGAHAGNDLVLLRRGQSAPVVAAPQKTAATFEVNSTENGSDANPGNGICATAQGICTLRAAIEEANANPGSDMITFRIGTGGPQTINPTPQGTPFVHLPNITGTVTIDATTQPGFAGSPIIELSGALIPANLGRVAGLTILANDCVVKGLVINRFGGDGIRIRGSNNIIEGNYIGTGLTGLTPQRNQGNGIHIDGTFFEAQPNVNNNRIGGATAAARNVISDNGDNGVLIDGSSIVGVNSVSEAISSASGNLVQGNYIGANRDGSTGDTFDLGNLEFGVLVVNASGNIIGGPAPGEGNLIIDNGIVGEGSIGGVRIAATAGETAALNRVQGNLIGTNASSSLDLSNYGDGVSVRSATDSTIGGTTAGARNVISGNDGSGVDIFGGSGALVQGNLIGTNVAGTGPLGNTFDGVSIAQPAPSASPVALNHAVGGAASGAGNVIAFNGGADQQGVISARGVSVLDGTRNAIQGNSIYSNTGLGIDLGNNGVTQNDAGDGDAGPNNLQNYPVLSSAVSAGSNTLITGQLNSAPNGAFRIEFFGDTSCDPSGFGEGRLFLGATNVTTNANGSANITFTTTQSGLEFITATATDANGNTSEFSRCIAVRAAVVDLSITKTDSPDPVNAGSQLTYTIQVRNNIEADAATNVVVTDPLPTGVTFNSVTTSQGSCTAPAVGAGGTVTCAIGTLNPNQLATITIVVTVSPTANGTIRNTARVTRSESDRNPDNDSAFADTTVIGRIDLAIAKTASPAQVVIGNQLTYTIAVTNSGPATATGVTVTDPLPQNVTLSSAGPTQGTCGASAGTVTCNLGALAPQATARITIVVNVLPAAVGSLTNTARVRGDQADANPDNDASSVTTPVVGVANLVMTKTSATTLPGPGDDISYTLRVSNEGPSAASDVVMTDAIPPNTSFKSFSISSIAPNWACLTPPVGAGGTVSCGNRSMLPAESVSFVLVVTVNNNVAGGTQITNTASVASPTRDSDASNNSARVVTPTGAPNPQVVVGRTIEIGPIQALREPSANPASGAFVIGNTGNAPLYLTPVSLLRIMPNADKMTQPADDRSLFNVLYDTPSGERQMRFDSEGTIVVMPQQQLRFRALFNPIIPMRAGKTSGLAPNQALPEMLTSRLTLAQRAGNPVTIDLIGKVSASARLIHPLDPRRAALITLAQSGNGLTTVCWIYDPNHDVYLVRYQFLNSSGNAIGSPVDTDISQELAGAGLARGQVFSVEQAFQGAANLGVARVRVTIFDRDNSNDSATSGAVGAVEPAIATVSAASFTEFGLAGESIVAGFGAAMASGTEAATASPLPTSLGGVSVRIRDGAGIERPAPLFFVSPDQINYQLPAGVSPGTATVTVTNGANLSAIGAVRIAATMPGLFAANGDGKGVAAAVALRVRADGSQSYEPVARYDQARGQFVSIPIDPGPPTDQIFLIFFGTGVRYRSSLGAVGVTIGGFNLPVLYAGAQGLAGLDQINVALPRSLSGRGEVDVALTVDGRASNIVRINIGGAANFAAAPTMLEELILRPLEFTPRAAIAPPPVPLSRWMVKSIEKGNSQ